MKRLISILGAALALAAIATATAQAAPGCSPSDSECPPLAGQFGSHGSGAGQLNNPRGIAADPVTGEIVVGESANRRVSVFDAKGQFIRAWGRGVLDGSPEAQVCTAATGCQAASAGTLGGEFSQGGRSVALDMSGDVWVLDSGGFRLQKFTPNGEFLLMVGGEVNKTKVAQREAQEANSEPVTVTEAEENLCTAASGDLCGAGVSGTGDGQFKELGLGNSIALDPDGLIYVGDESRIQKFDQAGAYQGSIPLPGAGVTRSVAIAPSGRIYVISDGILVFGSRVVREIAPDGSEIARLEVDWDGFKAPRHPHALATDAEGNVYVTGEVRYVVPWPGTELTKIEEFGEVLAFDPAGSLISFEPERAGFGRPPDTSKPVALATNVRDVGSSEPGPVYVGHFDNGGLESVGGPKSYIRAYGPPFGEPEPEAPSIASQHAAAVTVKDAVVEAQISPNFATDTTFWVEYGTGKCSEGGCESLAPAAPQPLSGPASKNPRSSGPVTLAGLEPGTLYHYRFVAENGAGGPVFAPEESFRTYAKPVAAAACPNDAVRLGASALLPDCRAHELVSPLDKEGGRVVPLAEVPGYPAELKQARPDGEEVTYSSYRAFANPDSAPYSSQYLARRDPVSGWQNEAISPPREGVLVAELKTPYRIFSEDLSQAWLTTSSEPLLATGGLPGYRNLYRRDNTDGSYQAQCSTPPPGLNAGEFNLEPQGHSADGSHFVFRAKGALTPDAAAIEGPQLYECVDGTELRLVSVLPGGGAAGNASAGTASEAVFNDPVFRYSSLDGAVSADGSRIFWSATPFGSGPLYARIDGQTTVEIAPANATFRTASPDGTRAIYTVGGQLFAATVDEDSATIDLIAGNLDGFMGASEDARLIYFVSDSDLDADGPAEANEHNLYLHRSEEDTYTFIAALSDADSEEFFNIEESEPRLTPVARSPYSRSSRVSADGEHAVFASNAPLTGYDNTDQASGEPLAEVFRYDAAAAELLCVSCNPSGAQPLGQNRGTTIIPYWSAATIPGWDDAHHASRVLAEDGSRVFFEAEDALALADTNGARDVYQWEEAGAGSCTTASPSYSPDAAGCIDLISSGKSPRDSELVDASADGSDVFFRTASSLWSPDPGLVDIYDARVGGGFAPPPPPAAACEGDACQPPSQTPSFPTPASSTFQGAGNVTEKPKPKPCRKARKGAKKGKARCVKPKHSNRNRRASR